MKVLAFIAAMVAISSAYIIHVDIEVDENSLQTPNEMSYNIEHHENPLVPQVGLMCSSCSSASSHLERSSGMPNNH